MTEFPSGYSDGCEEQALELKEIVPWSVAISLGDVSICLDGEVEVGQDVEKAVRRAFNRSMAAAKAAREA